MKTDRELWVHFAGIALGAILRNMNIQPEPPEASREESDYSYGRIEDATRTANSIAWAMIDRRDEDFERDPEE